MRCMHRMIIEVNLGQHGHRRKSQPCPNAVQANGWCRDHQESSEIMAIGARYEYPGLVIGPLEIGEGFAWWLAFACVAGPGRVTQIREAVERAVAL